MPLIARVNSTALACVVSVLALCLGGVPVEAVEAAPATFDCLVQPSAEVELSAPAAGIVSEVLVDRGDRVTKGQIVARLKDEIERANLAVAEYRARATATLSLKAAKLEFENRRLARNADLIEKSVLTEKEAEEMRISRDAAFWENKEAEEVAELSRLQAEQAKAELKLREVHAPIDGVVTERKRQPGESSAGSYIMKLAQLDPLYVETFVPAPLGAKLRVGQKVAVMNETLTEPWQAEISVIDSVADAASGMLKVRAKVQNSSYDKLSGLRCSATFELN